MIHTRRYGRHLGDFEPGQSYAHPWEVTVDEGTVALFQGAFLHAAPCYASRSHARELGFDDRPVPPLLVMNLALSFSVHDVSEQCIAHLAYVDMAFPEPLYAGSTVRGTSTCIGVEPHADGKRGVVRVRTHLVDERDRVVCWFERLALMRAGTLGTGAQDVAGVGARPEALPGWLADLPSPPARSHAFAGVLSEFAVGDVYCHQVGKTVGESEHLMLTSLVRNSHPLHFDAAYCADGGSFTGERVVMGGLVFAWAASLASRDMSGREVWDLGYRDGAHTGPVHAGDTLYAASRVLELRPFNERYGALTTRLVAVKGAPADGDEALFVAERDKPRGERSPNKVFEITRTTLIPRG